VKKLKNILIPLVLLSIIFSACKDDPVSIKPPPTPTNDDMYTWETISLTGLLYDVYATDTANVFINKKYMLMKYDGDTLNYISLNDPGFLMESIDGYDKDNIFLGGGYNIINGNPILKKMQNGNFINYTITNDNGTSIWEVLCTGPNEAWVSTITSSYVYKFNAGSFEQYLLDDSVFYSRFFKDLMGNVYAFGICIKHLTDTGRSEVLMTYKLENNQFNLKRMDTLYSPYTGQQLSGEFFRCGADFIMVGGPKALSRFTGNNWEGIVGLPPEHQFIQSHVGGTSKDFLILFAAYNWLIYIWDGEWHKEDSFHVAFPALDPLVDRTIIIKEPNVYLTVSAPPFSYSYFIIGRKNKKRSNNQTNKFN